MIECWKARNILGLENCLTFMTLAFRSKKFCVSIEPKSPRTKDDYRLCEKVVKSWDITNSSTYFKIIGSKGLEHYNVLCVTNILYSILVVEGVKTPTD